MSIEEKGDVACQTLDGPEVAVEETDNRRLVTSHSSLSRYNSESDCFQIVRQKTSLAVWFAEERLRPPN